MTDKIIMGLVFVLVVLIVVAVILYSIFGKKENTTCIDWCLWWFVAAPTPAPFSVFIRNVMNSAHIRK